MNKFTKHLTLFFMYLKTLGKMLQGKVVEKEILIQESESFVAKFKGKLSCHQDLEKENHTLISSSPKCIYL